MTDNEKNTADFTPDMFGGNPNACALMEDLAFVSHLWDDLIDGDKERSIDAINRAFEIALVRIPGNSFYQQNFAQLHPLVQSGVIGYLTANRFESDKEKHGLEIAHGLRYAVANVAAYIVFNTNSRERALEILSKAWKCWMPERIEDYLKEHSHA